MVVPGVRERESRKERERRRNEWRPVPLYIDAPTFEESRRESGGSHEKRPPKRVVIIDDGGDPQPNA